MQVDKVARKLRHEIKSSKSNMSWPLLTSQLSSENTSLRSLQRRFLNILLHDDGGRPLTTKVSSFAQDLLYAVIKENICRQNINCYHSQLNCKPVIWN